MACDVKWLDQPPLSESLLQFGKQRSGLTVALIDEQRTYSLKESKRQRMREICVCLCQWASCVSHDFLFGLFTTATCTLPIDLKAHSVSPSLNLLTSDHERRQVTVLLFTPVWVKATILQIFLICF